MTQVFTPGIYLVDKPTGPSSHTIVNYFRRHSGIKRIGHTGTLDPLASGLLIVLVGREFTKLQDQYLKQDKSYLVQAQLGWVSDTYDCTGQVQEQLAWPKLATLEEAVVARALTDFLGLQQQVVPSFSAVKIAGQKLYQRARLGQSSQLPSRQVRISTLRLLAYQKDMQKQTLSIELEVACSSGTYIRSLVHDLGIKLGVGAMVTQLRRTQVGDLHVKKAMSLEDFHWSEQAPPRTN